MQNALGTIYLSLVILGLPWWSSSLINTFFMCVYPSPIFIYSVWNFNSRFKTTFFKIGFTSPPLSFHLWKYQLYQCEIFIHHLSTYYTSEGWGGSSLKHLLQKVLPIRSSHHYTFWLNSQAWPTETGYE